MNLAVAMPATWYVKAFYASLRLDSLLPTDGENEKEIHTPVI